MRRRAASRIVATCAFVALASVVVACRPSQPGSDPKPAPNSPLPQIPDTTDEPATTGGGGTKPEKNDTPPSDPDAGTP